MSKIVKVATLFEENTRYTGMPNNPLVRETTTSPDHTPTATHTALSITPGRTYMFTTTISSLMAWGAATVDKNGMVVRKFVPVGGSTNVPYNYSIIAMEGEDKIYINNRDYGEVEITYDAEEANYMPGQYKNTSFRPFRFWCQTVLPLVYDDSLSYYELLSKVVSYLNATIGDLNKLTEEYSNIRDAYKELENYVNNYFENLDVSAEINAKLDKMAEDGDFNEIVEAVLSTLDYEGIIGREVGEQLPDVVGEQIGGVVGEQIGGVVGEQIGGVVGEQIDNVVAEQIDNVVGEQIGGVVNNRLPSVVSGQIDDVVAEQIEDPLENWLNVHFTNPPVDKSLSISNAAADAKVVGEALENAKDIEVEYYTKEETPITNISTVSPGYISSVSGDVGETVRVIQGGEFPTSVKVIRNLDGGETYRVKMTFPYTSGVAPIVTNNYSTQTREANFIEFAAGSSMTPGETYDFYVTIPYNATEIICVVQNNTAFSVSRVTNHFKKNYDIEIENYKNRESLMTGTEIIDAYISKNGSTVNASEWYAKIYEVKPGDKVKIVSYNTDSTVIVPAMFFGNFGTPDVWRIDAATNADSDEDDYIEKSVVVPSGINTLVINSEGGSGYANIYDPFKFDIKSEFNFADKLSIEGYTKDGELKDATTSYADQAFNDSGVLVEHIGTTGYVYQVTPEERIIITTQNPGAVVYTLWNNDVLLKKVYWTDNVNGQFYIVVPYDCNKLLVNGKGSNYRCEIVDVTSFLAEFEQFPKIDSINYVGDFAPVVTVDSSENVTYDWRKAIPNPPTPIGGGYLDYTLKARVTSEGAITYTWEEVTT